jgi:hypothetical protein
MLSLIQINKKCIDRCPKIKTPCENMSEFRRNFIVYPRTMQLQITNRRCNLFNLAPTFPKMKLQMTNRRCILFNLNLHFSKCSYKSLMVGDLYPIWTSISQNATTNN